MPDSAHRSDDITDIHNVWIPMRDGTQLAARIWLPADAKVLW